MRFFLYTISRLFNIQQTCDCFYTLKFLSMRPFIISRSCFSRKIVKLKKTVCTCQHCALGIKVFESINSKVRFSIALL
ncbi:hypothetical protein P856_611 [Candidatus Endolissoclinum faulkneri L5]|uniref:Uncharacterized protein n=1 Tax=Candidatus Endolissoclinum faulkneri L5 TaxID=1401328 RepID=V9TUJ6_9PROT|nr:hypothetical protein P856_611 [Candidatus Endolissoclinum faulkneri L5]